MISPELSLTAVVFPSAFGWFGMVVSPNSVICTKFGFTTLAALQKSFQKTDPRYLDFTHVSDCPDWIQLLAGRLQDYFEGAADSFADVPLQLDYAKTNFQAAVLQRCRDIAYGRTLTYGQLAAQAGNPGAARAVGNVMASNRVPIIVPCHRVVASNGGLGGFSAIGGVSTKQRLLDLEAANLGEGVRRNSSVYRPPRVPIAS